MNTENTNSSMGPVVKTLVGLVGGTAIFLGALSVGISAPSGALTPCAAAKNEIAAELRDEIGTEVENGASEVYIGAVLLGNSMKKAVADQYIDGMNPIECSMWVMNHRAEN